jgi:hypothetical protein
LPLDVRVIVSEFGDDDAQGSDLGEKLRLTRLEFAQSVVGRVELVVDESTV